MRRSYKDIELMVLLIKFFYIMANVLVKAVEVIKKTAPIWAPFVIDVLSDLSKGQPKGGQLKMPKRYF